MELRVFENKEFGKVRTDEVDGKILFCGSDVAKILGYTNPNKAINHHCIYRRFIIIRSGTGTLSAENAGKNQRAEKKKT